MGAVENFEVSAFSSARSVRALPAARNPIYASARVVTLRALRIWLAVFAAAEVQNSAACQRGKLCMRAAHQSATRASLCASGTALFLPACHFVAAFQPGDVRDLRIRARARRR